MRLSLYFLSFFLRILEVLCRNLRLENEFDYAAMAHATPGFVGGDLTLLVKEAAMMAIQRILKQPQGSHDDKTSACMLCVCL